MKSLSKQAFDRPRRTRPAELPGAVAVRDGNRATAVAGVELARMTEANAQIAADRNLGRGFEVGQGFFCPLGGAAAADPEGWYRQVIDREVAPLVREYWFDDEPAADDVIDRLLSK